MKYKKKEREKQKWSAFSLDHCGIKAVTGEKINNVNDAFDILLSERRSSETDERTNERTNSV